MLNIEFYRPIVHFLAQYLGRDTEILLCDTQKILLAENPMNDDHCPGAPLSEIQQSLVANPEYSQEPYRINYPTLSNTGANVRSATMFIRDGENLAGLLTINTNVEELVRARRYLEFLIMGESEGKDPSRTSNKKGKSHQPSYEVQTVSVTEVINTVMNEAVTRFGVPISRLTANEKLSVIRELNSRGAFLAKGSVNEVALRLGSSKASIYRYLHQLEE